MEYYSTDLSEETKLALTDIEKQFIQMRASGSTIRDIAKKLNKSTHTICEWNKKFFKNIIDIQSAEFRELQKKIISYKSARLDFLKEEFENVKKSLAQRNLTYEKKYWKYDDYLDLMLRLSDIMDKFELDMLSMAGNHKNIRTANIINTENDEEEIASVANDVPATESEKNYKTNDKQNIENNELKT